jgi:hypothetical protein
LIPDSYISLVSQFNAQPLQLPFVKVVSTACGETFNGPHEAPNAITVAAITSVTK